MSGTSAPYVAVLGLAVLAFALEAPAWLVRRRLRLSSPSPGAAETSGRTRAPGATRPAARSRDGGVAPSTGRGPGTGAARRPAGSAVLASWSAASAAALLVPAPHGLVLAVAIVALLPRLLARLEPAAVRRERERVTRDLPVAADLYAACVLGGADPVVAAEAVVEAVGGPLGARLDAVTRAVRLGSTPEQAWAGLVHDPVLGGWGRAMARTASTGAPVATVVTRIADEARSVRRCQAAASAHRAGVRATAPLGLCFLPAFVLLGIVPLVASLLGSFLSGLV